ncbi:CPBP family intramembrane glutamic endopeptidase [Pseudonocardia humida]|uniref:CPBP family intramembrane metalloprotease n=1 Tax=Pseudonocardia humida TaxID=2800819 RepID=A0ABT1A1I3_9PSEU|nr:CPBP family intramembrane glutamic endopeptidase [Pseudonocardia humida]MCO1656850.1 CPBP family intramembrane metalloprotease [Pseudonocardia humida]
MSPRVFLALTYGLSWALWAVALALGGDISDPFVYGLHTVAFCGPTLVAWSLALTGRPGTRQARLSTATRWLPAAVLIGLAPAVGAAVLAPLFGGTGLDPGLFADAAARTGGWLPYVGLALLTGPLAEEFGWRGYLQPLLRRTTSARRTPFVLGLFWALWHVPLFFVVGILQHAMGLFTVQALGFFVVLVLQSVGLLYVSERLRGGVPAAVLLHLVLNMAIVLVPLDSIAVALAYVALHALIALALLRFVSPPGSATGTAR